MRHCLLACLLGLLPGFLTLAVADEFTLLDPRDQPRQMVQRYAKRLASEALAGRQREYAELKTAEEIAAYAARRREFFIRQLGGWPARTPLNPQVVGRIAGPGYQVEKLLFESRPGFHVTAMLYLPKGPGPHPVVVIPCGHTPAGKASAGHQKLCALLTRHGMAGYCYDPIGQGERYQVLNDQGQPAQKSTTEHTLVGVGSILVGRNTASYRIWDGIRSIDYLASRPDIDASRIGCTGISGGGTLTEYLMALDDRILAAAPGCAPTTFARRLETIGPGDAEQNIFGQIGAGFDHGDFSILRAPRPTLLLTASFDFVDIGGSWDLFREAKRVYTRLGVPERMDLVEAPEKHGFTRPLREASTHWMQRWLRDVDERVVEPEIATLPIPQLQVTERGQVLQLAGERSVFDLNLAHCDELAAGRKSLWSQPDRAAALAEVRRLAGIRPLADLRRPAPRRLGSVARANYRIEKLLFEPEPGIQLPALLWVPKQPRGARHLFALPAGKQAVLAAGEADKLAAAGALVLAIDLRGNGETGAGGEGLWGAGWSDIFLTYLAGRSLVGMQAEDLLLAADYLARRDQSADSQVPVQLVAEGTAATAGLHAAALEPALFAHLRLERTIASWRTVVQSQLPTGQLAGVVHAALTRYDLPDLVATLPPGSVELVEPIDQALLKPAAP